MMGRQISEAGIENLIERWEGLVLTAALPTPNDVPTAGFGHTGPDVVLGQTYTLDQAKAWLRQDLAWANAAVDTAVMHLPFSQHEFDACVSLTYNIGVAGFSHSTVLRLINAGDLAGAADAFLMWDRQHGTVLQGLRNRREVERQWFLTPDVGVE